MVYVLEIPNTFRPHEVVRHLANPGTTIRDWVRQHYANGEFAIPTVCFRNGKPVLRAAWEEPLVDRDVVSFVSLPQVPLWLVWVLIIAAVVVAILLPVPNTGGAPPESDPVFSSKGKLNTVRLGEPIEVCYGRNRVYPSLASRPFYRYSSDDQFQYALLCIGQGEYDVEAIQIGDTAIDNFEEVEYEVLPPGETTTLFATNVYTVPEVGGQTLFAPNEPEYVDEGWVGPFPACPTGKQTNKIEFDLVFPKGLYLLDKKGNPQFITVVVVSEKRLIDNAGNPLGDWSDLEHPLTFQGATTTPLRKTRVVVVPTGRYEVRLRRTDNKDTSTRAGNDVIWEGMRAFIIGDELPDFGNVTLLAVKIRATNNLNNRTQQQFNVICTRKLPVYESGGWSEPQVTRSLIWAFCDVFRANYGGQMADTFLDLELLQQLDAIYSSRGDYFDWVFRDAITVWEAARLIAKAGRAVPLIAGSLITMRRDALQDIPVAMFNKENIVEGSFQWDIRLWAPVENDGVDIEYTEPSTGYLQEQVSCILPGDTGDRPKQVRLFGVQSREQAYREGMYMLACERYLRENITFETGLEGYIPTYGDLIAVAHDVPNWGQSGYVVDAVLVSGTNYTLTLSEPLVFAVGQEHQLLLRGRKGEVIGPLTVVAGDAPQKVSVTIPGEIDFLLDGTTEPMLFLFGLSNQITKYVKVVRIEPQGGERIRIVGVTDDPTVYSFDELSPPPLAELPFPPFPPDLPEITTLSITQVSGTLNIVQISWTAAFGALSYLVQTSEDGENWAHRTSTPRSSVQLQVLPGNLYVRVAAINNGQGPWIQDNVVVGPLVGVDAIWGNLPSLQSDWWTVLAAVGYQIKIYDATGAPVLKRTTNLTTGATIYAYGYSEAVADGNIVRQMKISVDAIFIDEDTGVATPYGSPVEHTVNNPIPTAPSNPASQLLSEESDQNVYRLSWTVPQEADLIRLKVWLSPVNGFDPSLESPVLDQVLGSPGYAGINTSTDVVIPFESGGGHPAYYWRVALFDQWGSELTTNVSAEQTIAAYP